MRYQTTMGRQVITSCCALILAIQALACGRSQDIAQGKPVNGDYERGSIQNSAGTTPLLFVQDFYEWYVPLALGHRDGPSWELVITQRPSILSPQLLAELKEDMEAQAASPGEIVGLDFDPFLNAQDPCERYEVGRVTERHQGARIEIHAVCSGNRSPTPDIVLEVVPEGSSWAIENVHYPGIATDLRQVLKLLREGRE
jgi:hypothetical protein